MSTLITHNPAEQSPDDDPTGVRDLLSSLPQPAPMPDYLVERISASLAAEQAQRAAVPSTESMTPLLARRRRRMGRLVFAFAGAAAAFALFAVVGNLFQPDPASRAGRTTSAVSGAQTADSETLSRSDKSSPQAGALAGNAPIVQLRRSGTRYAQASFVTQARSLDSAAIGQTNPPAAAYADAGPVGTTAGLISCLDAIGAGDAQMVRADLAFYEGRPAVIIVATANRQATAYAVGRQCSKADPAVLRPATQLP